MAILALFTAFNKFLYTGYRLEYGIADELLNVCQGMGRRTRVSIESMEEGSLYIHGGQGLSRDAS
jgi:hypothetical protein